jgi:hypothetical protein
MTPGAAGSGDRVRCQVLGGGGDVCAVIARSASSGGMSLSSAERRCPFVTRRGFSGVEEESEKHAYEWEDDDCRRQVPVLVEKGATSLVDQERVGAPD